MDSLSQLLAMLAPTCAVNLHCRFAGRWEAGHDQLAPGVVPWHVVLHGEARLVVEGRHVDVRAGDVLLLPHGSPHLLQSLVEWGQVVPALKHDNGILTEVRSPAKGEAVEVLCGEFDFGPHSGWLFAHESHLIHLQTNHWQACPELEMLLMMLVRESLGSLPGNATIAKGLADTLLALILRLLLSLHEPPAGLLRLMSNKRLAPRCWPSSPILRTRGPWKPWPSGAFYPARHLPAILPAAIRLRRRRGFPSYAWRWPRSYSLRTRG